MSLLRSSANQTGWADQYQAQTGWANHSNERGLAWANRVKPCKSYFSRPYIHVHPRRIAFFVAQKCPWVGSTLPQVLAICAICAIWVLHAKHSPQVPCYMCYMCYISQGNPLNIHSPRVPCYMCYMCYMGLTRQPTEHPLSPGSLLYVLYVLYAQLCVFGQGGLS